MRRLALVLLLAAAVAAGSAAAHKGEKAEPLIAVSVLESRGVVRTLGVRLIDRDSSEPVRAATVLLDAEMTTPHLMRTTAWSLSEVEPGIYAATVRFPMPASWTVRVRVSGERVVSAQSRFPLRVDRQAVSPGAPAPPRALPTRLADDLTERDVVAMFSLWVHGGAALAWIVGVLAMVIALGVGSLGAGFRARVRSAYLDWGAWLHWGLVPAIVLTGVYQMLRVTPFPLVWRPGDIAALRDIPYGALYEAILIVKLGLFVALLITGTQVLLRVVKLRDSGTTGSFRSVLGPAGFVYLASIPLILAAAMALRYVHILNHTAQVLSER